MNPEALATVGTSEALAHRHHDPYILSILSDLRGDMHGNFGHCRLISFDG